MEAFGWVKLVLENWKTLVTIAGLLAANGVTGCQWSNAETKAQNERKAATYLAENMLNVPTSPPPRRLVHTTVNQCNLQPVLDKLDLCLEHVRNH